MSEEVKKENKTLSLKKKIIRSSIVVAVLITIFVLAYYILVWTGAWEYINSVDKVREMILSIGIWGRLVFVIIQFLQVTFIPIPSTISTLAGVLIYGPLEASLLSMAGIFLGSVVAFWLGRHFGKKLVTFMVGEESCKKWSKFLTNAKYSFFVMMLLPIFPDDVLCLVAGLTNMSWTFFVVTNLICRPVGILTTCYLGSGHIIPYHGWGLAVWALIIILVAITLFLSYKYQKQIENFLQTRFKSKKDIIKEESVDNKDSSLKDENVKDENVKDEKAKEEKKDRSISKDKKIDSNGKDENISQNSTIDNAEVKEKDLKQESSSGDNAKNKKE